jgi:hypothetical protein
MILAILQWHFGKRILKIKNLHSINPIRSSLLLSTRCSPFKNKMELGDKEDEEEWEAKFVDHLHPDTGDSRIGSSAGKNEMAFGLGNEEGNLPNLTRMPPKKGESKCFNDAYLSVAAGFVFIFHPVIYPQSPPNSLF